MSAQVDLFSDFFAHRDNAVSRLDARVKFAAALCAIVAMLAAPIPIFPLLVCVANVGLLLRLRVPLKLLLVRLVAPFGVAGVIVVTQAFFYGKTPLGAVGLLGFESTAYREGLHRGLWIAARVLGCVSVVLLLGLTTPTHSLFRALSAFKVSRAWIDIALVTYRYIFVFLEDAFNIWTAQRVRLGYSRLSLSLKSIGVLAGAVMCRSYDQALRTAQAMRARGFTGEMPRAPMPPLRRQDVLAAVAWLACVAMLAGAGCGIQWLLKCRA